MTKYMHGGQPSRRRVVKHLALAATAGLALALGVSAGQAEDKTLTIGYSTYTVANPAFAGIIQGMKSQAEGYGYKFILANSNNSASQQIADVESLLAQGANYIVITPADGTAIAPAVATATAANVPVIALADHIVTPVTATYSMDHVEGGKLAAEAIVKFLTAKYGSPKGNVVNIQGIAGIVATNQRDQGLVEELAKYPDIKIVASADGGFNTDKANEVMTTILQAQPEIDAVFGANDAETYGAITAIKAADRFAPIGDPAHIYTIGIDGAAPAINGIRDGSQDATVSQQFIKMGIKMMENVHAKETGKAAEIPSVVWPLMVIDSTNINSDAVKEYGIWADDVK